MLLVLLQLLGCLMLGLANGFELFHEKSDIGLSSPRGDKDLAHDRVELASLNAAVLLEMLYDCINACQIRDKFFDLLG